MLSPIKASCLSKLSLIRHGFFTRGGGVSEGIYASLNCGMGSNDDRDAVLENRGRVCDHLGSEAREVLTVHQCHSAIAVRADGLLEHDALPKADAIVTTTRGLVIGALAADCAPVLLAEPVAGVIACAHAGWRGAVGGIIEAVVVEMEHAGARRDRIRAALGPCISQEAYEVGPEFEARLLDMDSRNARFFATPPGRERAHFDLPGYVCSRLQEARVATLDNVSRCTMAGESKLFSYRRSILRSEPDYGRQISAIVLT